MISCMPEVSAIVKLGVESATRALLVIPSGGVETCIRCARDAQPTRNSCRRSAYLIGRCKDQSRIGRAMQDQSIDDRAVN